MTSMIGRHGHPKRRIRNYLLNPRFQLKYTGLIVGVALVLMLGLGAVILATSNVAAQQARQAVQQSYAATEQAERAMRESQTSSRILHMQQLSEAADNPELVQTITRELDAADRQAQRNLAEVEHGRELADAQRAAIEKNRRRTVLALLVSALFFVVVLGAAGIVITHKIIGPVFKLKRLLRQVGTGRLDIRDRLRKGDELEDLFETFLAMVESLKSAQQVELSKIDAIIAELSASGVAPAALERLRTLRSDMTVQLQRPESTRPPPPYAAP